MCTWYGYLELNAQADVWIQQGVSVFFLQVRRGCCCCDSSSYLLSIIFLRKLKKMVDADPLVL
jgi:hypothetical protein